MDMLPRTAAETYSTSTKARNHWLVGDATHTDTSGGIAKLGPGGRFDAKLDVDDTADTVVTAASTQPRPLARLPIANDGGSDVSDVYGCMRYRCSTASLNRRMVC